MRLNPLAIALSLAVFALPLTALAQDAAATADPAQQTNQASETPASSTEAVDAPAASVDAPAATADAPAAEAPKSNFTWNLSATSDYVFRGVSQTSRKPAIQGGLDYAFGDSGFYVGGWGSNVDFGDHDGPDIELDTYVGYSKDVSADWNVDFSVLHYAYFGERSTYGSIDYNEYFVKTTYNKMLTFTLGYANDYANANFSSLYFNIGGTWDIGNDFSLNAGVGHSRFSGDNGSYSDWNLGVSRQFGPVNAALNYYDTNLSQRTSDTVVLTLALGS